MLYARALEESKIAVFRDVCLSTDTPNCNGRIYPRAVMDKLLAEMEEKVRTGQLYGGLITEKGEEGWTTTGASLGKLSHVVTDLHLDENGDLIATVDILNTPNGKLVVDLLEAKAVGLFTRGSGSIVRDEATGHMVVQPDFALESVDFCLKEKKTWPQRSLKSLPETQDSNASTD